ncbi:Cof-type HAD-IIB family hydrolase [Butyrivibrio sp. NC3005]|uniref:Cof-type HAD-IIB family hydrolase n=1 Tax=Butyrivibrio sp. NC3005 TaxID=1280685 RepID=UPI0004116F76|nr:Cof-type HAD-IIB family hydrolase [Butyrivibrio sp. NC3005]
MGKKIFHFDLDGTLLNDEKMLTDKTRQALEVFVDKGNHFVINTGRAIDSAKKVYEDCRMNFKGSFLVGFNGCQIYDVDKDELVYRETMELSLVKEVFKVALRHGIHCHTFTDDTIISPDNGECMQYYKKVIKTPLIVTDDIYSQLTVNPSKCIAIELHDHDKMENFRKEVASLAPDKLKVMYSNDYYLEIFPQNAGKGAAVKKLCQMLEVDIKDSYAAGDQQNDIDMIQTAGCGIAMLNAVDALKQAADRITKKDNNNDGLYDEILQACQIENI